MLSPKKRHRNRRNRRAKNATTSRRPGHRQRSIERLEDRCLLAVDILQTNVFGNEGDFLTIDLNYSGEESIEVNWGDGNINTFTVGGNGRPGTGAIGLTHQYLDDPAGTPDDFTITATGSTEDVDTAIATVSNVDPTITSFSAMFTSGSDATLTGTLFDPGTLDTFTLNIDWGDPASAVNIESVSVGSSFSLIHTYSNDTGPFTITATVVDDDGGESGEATTVLAAITPDVVLNASTFINEGDTGTIIASLVTPGTEDPFVATEDVTVTVAYSGTADNGVDYTVVDTIVILEGSSSGSIVVSAVDDGLGDPNETIIVDITAVDGGNELGQQQATITIVEEVVPVVTNPLVLLSIDFEGIAEAGGVATVTARLVDPVDGESTVVSNDVVTVDLAFSGQAILGTDYTASATSIVIAAGSSSGTATITAIDDNPEVDPIESVVVDIAGVTNGVEAGEQQVSTFITEFGAVGVVLSVDTSSILEAGGVATLTATLFNPLDPQLSATSSSEITVNLGFAGTATGGGTDYTAAASIVIPASTVNESFTSASIPITAVQDLELEGDETIVASITSVTGATNVVELGEQEVTTTILDDDVPVVVLSSTPALIAEDGGVAQIIASLEDPITREPVLAAEQVTVNVSFLGTADGGGVDYTASGTQIVIPVGSASGFVTVTAVDDLFVEGNETVQAIITGATNAIVGGTNETLVAIVDDDGEAPALAADAGGPYAVDENGSVQLDGSGSIAPEGSTFAWDLDGDGVFGETGAGAERGDETGATPTFSASGVDGPATFPVQLRITSGERQVFDSATVNVNNVAPTIDEINLSASSIDEGQSVTVTGTFSDPAFGLETETFTGTATWSDGVQTAVSIEGNSFSTTRSFPDDHPDTGTASDDFTVDVTISDDDEGSNTETSPVLTVNNVAPTVGPMVLSESEIDESQSVTVTGSFTDPALGVATESFTGSALWSDGVTTAVTVNEDGTFSTSRDFPDDHPSTGTPSDTFTVDVTITDDDGGSDTETSPVLTVNNVDPVITSASTDATFANKAEEDDLVTFTASFTDVGVLDTHTATIDWGDGTTTSGTVNEVNGSGTVTGTHAYAVGGIYTITVTVTDDDTGEATASASAVVTGAGVNNGILYVVGTNEDDQVTINEKGNGQFKVHANFFSEGNHRTFSDTVSQIIVYLCDGDDHLNVAGNIDQPLIAHGGAGNDHLNGGGGPTVLDGGSGDDDINGGGGRDIQVGGTGADRLVANSNDDILIAGSLSIVSPGTLPNDHDTALLALLAEWNGNEPYLTRVNNLRNGTGASGFKLEKGTTVNDDSDIDTLTGSSGLDWFLYDLDLDIVTDLGGGEEEN